MKPFFIPGSAGNLFAVYWPPEKNENSKAILHIPAFADEMNKSRHMVALQAKSLSLQGYGVLVIDPFGTGESSGDFAEATWSIWLNDIASALEWLKRQGAQQISLWSLRTGSLLAMDFVHQYPKSVQRILFWQPIVKGETFVMQFLRLRVAAAFMNNGSNRERTSDLKRQLINGDPLEVAGYTLNPELINPMLNLQLEKMKFKSVEKFAVFELTNNIDSQINFQLQKFITNLQQNSEDVELFRVIGDNFWATQEIVEAPDLIESTSQLISQWNQSESAE